MKQKKSWMPVIILLIFGCLFTAGGIYYLYFYNYDAVERQNTEEDLADAYLDDLIAWADSGNTDRKQWLEKMYQEPAGSDKKENLEKETLEDGVEKVSREPEETWTDDNWYVCDGVMYTPDYAKGYVQCVLEVPAAKIRRGVYTGTWDEIYYDLDIWMVTAARPDYVLGKTHFCIYGHNHTKQDLSFNRLKDVQVGDTFTLTSETGRYEYQVTDIFAVSRESASADYVDNFGRSGDNCYLITCGRGENRYLDLIVEGTLTRHLTLKEYAEERTAGKK